MALIPTVKVEPTWQILPDGEAAARAESPLTCITIPMGTASARQVMPREHAEH